MRSPALDTIDDLKGAPPQALCIEAVFGAGVTFGIAAALTVPYDPFSTNSERPIEARIG